MFGHFAGTETSVSQRNLSDPNNETILDGQLGDTTSKAVMKVVTAKDINNVVFDGFTVTGANYLCMGPWDLYTGSGVYLDGSDISIVNCKLKNNSWIGLEAVNNSSANIHNCLFVDNMAVATIGDATGIHIKSSSTLDMSNSVVRNNGTYGIYLKQAGQANIKNCWIHNNGADSYYYGSGIYIESPSAVANIRNCTIYDNYAYGIYETGSYDPNILNCIIYENDTNDLSGSFTVNYSSTQVTHTGNGNRIGDPNLVDADSNDLHLSSDSNCIDTGDPNGDYDETDIDGEDRIYNSRVDMGADEFTPESVELGDAVFSLKDNSDQVVAWFDDLGNLSIDGTLEESSNHTATANDEFRFQDSGGNDVAIIDATNGNAYIDGTLYEEQSTLTPASDDIIFKDSSNNIVGYIDDSGNLYLKGKLYENSG